MNMEKLPAPLETALLNLDRFGIRPSGKQLEELVRCEYLESDENDGWNTSYKGQEYLTLHKLKV